jgi:spore coat polysaccharide biosynthesis protein SpsF
MEDGQSYKLMKVGIIIQARVGSTRLPSKVLMPLPYGRDTTVIDQIIIRAAHVSNADCVILATSTQKENDALEHLVDIIHPSVFIFKGSEDDVLERYYLAAKKYQLSHVVRLTGDNPCIDPSLVEKEIENHLNKGADYTYSKGYPLGMNIEVIAFSALEKAYQQSQSKSDREHVTAFIRNRPEEFQLNFSIYSPDYGNWRMTVDTPEDYTLMCLIYDYLYNDNSLFGLEELKNLFSQKPFLLNINNRIQQKRLFDSKEEEVQEAIKILEGLDLNEAAKKLKNESKV